MNMHLPKFEHQRPATLKEAAQLLKEYGSRAQIAAGGTDLYPRMKYGLLRPDVVISLRGLSAESPVTVGEGELHLDAFMSLADVVRSPEVLQRAPLWAEAAMNVASNQIRHMATLGGNLFGHKSHAVCGQGILISGISRGLHKPMLYTNRIFGCDHRSL
jgi:CO/xanthine dehydrogenase FAD-binding subunit